jgi:hypothetical protein
MQTIRFLTLAAALVVAAPLASAADMLEVYDVSAGKKLNIRSGPSLKNKVIGGSPTGTMLKSMGCKDGPEGKWCEIETEGGLKGYSFGAFLKEGHAMAEAAPAMKAAPAFAMGKLKCEKSNGTPVADCDYGIMRIAPGMARLQIIWPDATKRMFGIYKTTATSGDGPVASKAAADGTFDISLTPKGAPSEHYMVPADVLDVK